MVRIPEVSGFKYKEDNKLMSYKKDDIVKVTITDIGSEGEGIGKVDGYPFFIKDSLIGDKVLAKVMKAKKNYAYAKLLEVEAPSPDRVDAKCCVAKSCGGCQIQEMDYKAQLLYKENKVKNNLIRIGGFSKEFIESVFEGIEGMDNPWNYRNKAQYPIGMDKEGKIIAGFYAGRTHSIIEQRDCSLVPSEYQKIIDIIIDYMVMHRISPYDEKDGSGILRHILIKKGFSTNQLMVVLVVNTSVSDKRWDKLIDDLSVVDNIISLQLNENMEQTNVILGNKCRVLYGTDYIEDVLCGLRFRISPLSFYQVNPVQTVKLYNKAIEFADMNGTEEVWDICCGIGTITLNLAKKARLVHGIEIVPEAIEDAKENAKLNGIENVEFMCAPAENYLPDNASKIKADIIVTDPPRKGMEPSAISAILSVNPEKIVYVSCDPATLSRDLKMICEGGYEIKRVGCVDMFPHSTHVETVVLMSRKDK